MAWADIPYDDCGASMCGDGFMRDADGKLAPAYPPGIHLWQSMIGRAILAHPTGMWLLWRTSLKAALPQQQQV